MFCFSKRLDINFEGDALENDCEGNITEIYKVLLSHNEEFTNLRIITGHTNDIISDHNEKLEAQAETIIEQNKRLEAQEEITTQLTALLNQQGSLIEKILEGPVRFHTQATQDYITFWPPNSVITFDSELVDSHSSMNHPQGVFTVPMNGNYQFSFYADIVTSETAVIFVHLNDKVVNNFQFFASNLNEKEILQRSIHFGLTLSQGDSVKLANGPDAHSLLALHNPIQFIGVLVNKT